MKRVAHINNTRQEVNWMRVGALELAFLGSNPDSTSN